MLWRLKSRLKELHFSKCLKNFFFTEKNLNLKLKTQIQKSDMSKRISIFWISKTHSFNWENNQWNLKSKKLSPDHLLCCVHHLFKKLYRKEYIPLVGPTKFSKISWRISSKMISIYWTELITWPIFDFVLALSHHWLFLCLYYINDLWINLSVCISVSADLLAWIYWA